jgi:hypothetical protein
MRSLAVRPTRVNQGRGRVDNLPVTQDLIVNRNWVVFRHGGYQESSLPIILRTTKGQRPKGKTTSKADPLRRWSL